MLKFLLAACALAFMSACAIDYAQTGTELRAAASASSQIKTSSYTVSRPVSAVAQSWRVGANKCLNRMNTTNMRGNGQVFVSSTLYQTTVQSLGSGRYEMTMKASNNVSLRQSAVIYTAVASASAGGARVEQTWQLMPLGREVFLDTIQLWSNGDTSQCPQLPF